MTPNCAGTATLHRPGFSTGFGRIHCNRAHLYRGRDNATGARLSAVRSEQVMV